MKRSIALILIVALMCFVSISAGASSQAGMSVADFTSTLLDGTAIDGSIFAKHKVTVVNYWATWCGPCVHELPFFQGCYADNGENASDVGVYGMLLLDGDSTESDAVDMLASFGFDYPCFTEDLIWRSVTNQSRYIPQTFFVDENGVILEVKISAYSSQDEIQDRIDFWLSKISEAEPAPDASAAAEPTRAPVARPTEYDGSRPTAEPSDKDDSAESGFTSEHIMILVACVTGVVVAVIVSSLVIRRKGKKQSNK